jgi:hypothetical protein
MAALAHSERFRVTYWHPAFVCMGAVTLLLLGWAFPRMTGAGFLRVLLLLGSGAVLPWYFGVVEVGAEGLRLYRINRLPFSEAIGARSIRLFGLPYLCISRTSGLPWLVPLYVTGPRPILLSLRSAVPASSQLGLSLAALVQPAESRVA